MIEEELFHRALEKPTPAEQLAFLDEMCAGQPELRQRVERLLRSHRKEDSFLAAGGMTRDARSETTGSIIGPYALVEPIGEGGMGSVWMAQQTEPVKRLVALKLIKAGMDSKQVIARFEAERQALALMDHPNIARVLDGGTTNSGRPFFVMDLVKGVPITKYCDEHHLTPRQRLELFIPVCQAVQHAHQKGIIHRDMKPSNVLVALYDGKPVPKVIDFGVAKAAGPSLTDKTLVTGFGSIVGTLEYMSPEQAEINQLDIDTRCDIYSLGVLLYELLAGSPPFTRKELEKAGMLEMLRVIREQEPSKPSTKLGSSDALPTLSANRGTEPVKLTKLVRGELDWIVMKALEKDRNRRYETANGFAMDVQRYLADERVLACPPSARYRFKKFMRRNKRPVLAASLVLVALVAGIIGTSWQAVRAEQRAVGERQAKERAETNFTLANEAVEKYLGTVTEGPDLKRADFYRLRKKLLESAIPFLQKIAEQKSDDPKVEAHRGGAHGRLGQVRQELGEFEAAVLGFDSSRAIFARLTADFPAEPEYRHFHAMSLTSMGNCLTQLGKREHAEAVLRQALGISQKLAADFPDDPEYRHRLAKNHGQLGILLSGLGRLVDAEAAFRQALAIEERVVGQFPTVAEYRDELAGSHNNLGVLFIDLGRQGEAQTAHLQALSIREKLVADYPAEPRFRHDLAGSHYNLGIVLEHLGKDEASETHYRQAINLDDQLVREFPTVPEYRKDLALSHNNLGGLLRDLGRLDDAETSFRHALPILESLVTDFQTVPSYRRSLAEAHSSLGSTLASQGKQSEAEAALRHAIATHERLTAEFPEVPNYAMILGGSYCNSGNMARDFGQPQTALGWFKKAIATLEPLAEMKPRLEDAREFLRNAHWGRALALDDLGRRTEATRDWKRAAELDDGTDIATFRLRIFRNTGDAAGCLAAVTEFEALKPATPVGMYEAACNRSVCAAAILADTNTPAADAPRLAKEQADLAMAWLRKTIAAGYRNVLLVKHDTNLDALREREDFKKLLTELEAKQKERESDKKPN